jgi:predicted nucleic acid-binding protein
LDRFSSALARRGAEPRAIIRERGNDLDPGERAAIALAQAKQTDVLLLIDEERGRQEAERRGIATAGTLGVLDAAAANGLLSLAAALQQLQTTNFYVSQRLLRHLLERDAGRSKIRN